MRATYVSRRRPNLWVVDKENGGKSDALNAGVNAAAHRYICAVDADVILEPDSLLRVAKPIVDDPELIAAAGGIVRVANGATSKQAVSSSSAFRAAGSRSCRWSSTSARS